MQLPNTPSFRLDGRKALITGASSGIGRACAERLRAEGAKVYGFARTAPADTPLPDGILARVHLRDGGRITLPLEKITVATESGSRGRASSRESTKRGR